MLLSQTYKKAAFSALSVLLPVLSFAADKSCDPVNKAGDLATKQTRIHYAADLLRPAVVKPSDKVIVGADKLMHSITVDNTNHIALDGQTFSTTVFKSPGERAMMSGLTLFQMADEGCRNLGKVMIAGRNAFVFEQGSTKSNKETLFKYWIDVQTGLPLRGTEDAPKPELKSFGLTKDRKPNIEVQSNANNERVINTLGFVFGDAVKLPKLSGAKNLFGQKGEMDAATETFLKALVKG